jgi:cytochrome c2
LNPNLKRDALTWFGLALAATVLLVGILVWQNKHVAAHGAIYLSTDPSAGADIFKQKGCANCHGIGPDVVPLLPGNVPSSTSLPKLVTAMWNHAPRMWERMNAEKLEYPELNYEQMARLVAYLYMSGYIDRVGDAENGERLFSIKGCIRCHAVRGFGGKRGPDLSESQSMANPMIWTQVMWNHAADMQERLKQIGLRWPRFEEDELRDLYAYVSEVSRRPTNELQISPADPENGWKVFRSKGCIMCHSLSESGQRHIGPALGPERKVPPTFFRFAESMLNHFPAMRRAVESQNQNLPAFEGTEMADVIAFVYSLRYLEPGGSPHVGESVFEWRGCSRCHGSQAEGTRSGPPLRGRGQSFTAVRLASILWRHGAKMYEQSRKMGQDWPQLQTSDIGDLLAFLNSPVEEKR